jgi:hypothetical protein
MERFRRGRKSRLHKCHRQRRCSILHCKQYVSPPESNRRFPLAWLPYPQRHNDTHKFTPENINIDAQAANHEEAHYGPDAHLFNPERWLNVQVEKGASTVHFGFGAGSRMCAGHLIATRLCYALLVRFILAFEVVASDTNPPNTDYVEYNALKTALVAIPRDFNVKLKMRDDAWLEGLIQQEDR